MKAIRIVSLIILGAGMLFPAACRASGKSLTLMLVPREEIPIRVGMDVGNRFPTLLVSYKLLPNGAVSLHGWSGSDWVNITPDSYRAGTFFGGNPTTALIVVSKGKVLPESLLPPESWCPSVYRIDMTDTRLLLHLIGRLYDFKFTDWNWFAENYRLRLSQINPEGLNIAWYQKQLKENLSQRDDAVMEDLQHLMVVRAPQENSEVLHASESEENVPINVDPVQAVEAFSVSEEAGAVESVNPLTNSIPEAIVLGEEDADGSAVPPEENEQSAEEQE